MSTETETALPQSNKEHNGDFDFTDVNRATSIQAAERDMADEVAAAHYAAADKRAGRAGGVFDFSEHTNPIPEGPDDDFDFKGINRDMAIQDAERDMADEVAAGEDAAAERRAGKAGGVFDFTEFNNPEANARADADRVRAARDEVEAVQAALEKPVEAHG